MSGRPPELTALLRESSWLNALAAGLVRRGEDPDDLVQETWLQALRAPPDPSRPARPWLAQVLRNALRMRHRAGARRRQREQVVAPPLADRSDPADVALDRLQLQRQLAELLLNLDELYRTPLVLHYHEGRTTPEIARALGLPAGTVRWRISEGLARLRAALDQAHGDDRWRAALIPLAAPRHGRRWSWAWPTVGGLGAVGGVALWMAAQTPGPPASSSRAPAVDPAPPAPPPSSSPSNPITQEETMRRENLRRAAALFGVALPALVASAEERVVTVNEAIDFCVEMREKTAVCKEEFADHFSAGFPPEQRARVRAKVLAELVADGTGPREPRRKACAAQAERKPPRYLLSDVEAARGCFAQPDCQKVYACLKPLIEKYQNKPAR